MEQINQHHHCKAIVNDNRYQIVDRRDQWSGSNSRINMNFMEQHRNQCAHQTGNDHGDNK